MKQRKRIGKKAEDLAAANLSSQGLKILERNYQIRQGEIDIIGWDGNILVFVEVKARENLHCGYPGEALSEAKIRRICYTAEVYCFRKRVSQQTQIRFDVIEILGDRIRHIKNAFESCY